MGSEETMVGSAAWYGRRWLWVILSILFALGFAVSTIMVHSERNAALDDAAARAREEAQLATATLTGKHLTKPVTRSSYDKLSAKIWKTLSSDGSIVGVTVWSSEGRILFSLNESLVGDAPAEMQSLITAIAPGSGSTRVFDNTVQTFTPVSTAPDGPVAIVEVDQPLAVVEAQTGDLWSTLRIGSALGLAVSLVFLGLTLVSSALGSAPEHEEEPGHAEQEADEDSDEGVEAADVEPPAKEEPPTEQRTPTYEEVFGVQHGFADGSLTDIHRDEEGRGDEGTEAESDGGSSADELPAEEPASISTEAEEPASLSAGEVQGFDADLDGAAVDQAKTPEPDGAAQQSMGPWPEEFQEMFRDMAREDDSQTQEMRQWREDFKARAEKAALRVKKQQAERHEAQPTPDR